LANEDNAEWKWRGSSSYVVIRRTTTIHHPVERGEGGGGGIVIHVGDGNDDDDDGNCAMMGQEKVGRPTGLPRPVTTPRLFILRREDEKV
jgi:hypothetical protein